MDDLAVLHPFQQYFHGRMAELQIRGGIEDNSEIIFLIFEYKHVLWALNYPVWY